MTLHLMEHHSVGSSNGISYTGLTKMAKNKKSTATQSQWTPTIGNVLILSILIEETPLMSQMKNKQN